MLHIRPVVHLWWMWANIQQKIQSKASSVGPSSFIHRLIYRIWSASRRVLLKDIRAVLCLRCGDVYSRKKWWKYQYLSPINSFSGCSWFAHENSCQAILNGFYLCIATNHKDYITDAYRNYCYWLAHLHFPACIYIYCEVIMAFCYSSAGHPSSLIILVQSILI